ncbi:metallopeptidase TldD-related protein [Anaeromicropila herbilytica]|uniref:Metalloprotease TldD/E C-terminal domain-containing protein n=1 Tax=Anaeromicropila herbilytica TaxID=2785025 RepID=A0A7R7IEJ8_9FIRM|nr:metallopeptidase TldD-related protein [Anaeromicropila herbilytica]BCN31178.1 hypothetical protein bsdtb5_24730 [Anaeromicropila herbilytica]
MANNILNKIVQILNDLDIKTYQINETREESVELFFIKKALDSRRSKDVTKYMVNVFRDFMDGDTKMRGSSSANIYNTMTEEEMTEAIKDAYFAASFVKNPFYELPSGKKEEKVFHQSSLAKETLESAATRMTKALFKEDNGKESFLNSAELFVVKVDKHIINSEGIDVSYDKYKVTGEFVVQCLAPEDVETYQDFSYDELDMESLEKKVKDTLDMTTARANATSSAKAGDYKVILSGKYVRDFLSYYASKSSANMIYPKYSDYAVGQMVQGDHIEGEALNINLVASEPYNDEGITFVNRPLLEDGVLKNLHGSLRFSRYLSIEPVGYYEDIEVKEGTVSFEEMKKGQYLHIVNFSDFQVDDLTGYFGGEIRLAFYCDGNTMIPVTGGSISGNISEASGMLTLSKELQKEKGYEGPYALSIQKVTIAQ